MMMMIKNEEEENIIIFIYHYILLYYYDDYHHVAIRVIVRCAVDANALTGTTYTTGERVETPTTLSSDI